MKKKFIVLSLALLLCFTVACRDEAAMAELEEFKAQMALEEQNMALATRYNEAWKSGNLEAIKEIYSPDFIWHASDGGDYSSEEMIEINREAIEQHKKAIPDLTIINEDVIMKGDKVITRYTLRGTHKGNVGGIPATGNKIELSGIEIIRIENGRIAESWEENNLLRFYQQLGMELKPKEVKEIADSKYFLQYNLFHFKYE
jgi:steroid delta-isomerase-like uncharacterized protein